MSPPAGDKDRAAVLRLSPDGRPAPPAATLLGTAPSAVSGLAPGRDGTVVAAGYGSAAERGTPEPATDRQFLLARLRSDGVLDPAFGGGAVLANLRASLWQGAAAHAVALQGNGNVVATGVAGFAAGAFEHGSYCRTARFNQDGRFDRTFGDSGRVLSLIAGRNCGAVAVFVASDGKILVVGSTPAPALVLLRYFADGTPDRRFGPVL